jgi:nucleoside-diphosphate-sugar epimerase
MLMEEIPYFQLSERMPDFVTRALSSMPFLKPVIPDVGARFQFVHEDDVASAFVAGTLGKGEPGPYNLAAPGTLTMKDLADALDWYTVPVPDAAVGATAEIMSRLPSLPEAFAWVQTVRKPVLMKTDRAKKQLGWKPEHTAKQTLKELVDAYRSEERVGH